MRPWLVAFAIGTVAPGLAVGSAALAQTSSKTFGAPTGAFDKLSVGNQKAAASLYEAQNAATFATGTSRPTSTARPLTLDENVARKQTRPGWGRFFMAKNARGPVRVKSVRSVVSILGRP